MKLAYVALTALLTFGVAADGNAVNFSSEKNLESRLRAATDARDASNPVFDEALKARHYEALEMLGQIGGDACKRLTPYFDDIHAAAVVAAFKGAAYCQDKSLAPALLAHRMDYGMDGYSAYMAALGFSGGKGGITRLVAAVNAVPADAQGPKAAAALYGLMQGVVYDRLKATALPDLNFPHVLKLAGTPAAGVAAAYLLGRLEGLDQVLDMKAVEAALETKNVRVRALLTRVLGKYGDPASARLIALAGSADRAVRYEAVRALGGLTDAKSQAFLMTTAQKGDAFMRQLALTALSRRAAEDKAVQALMQATVGDANKWLAATALEGVAAFDSVGANKIAADWLAGDDYYKAYKAMGILSHSDDGKAALKAYADAHADTVRGHDAAVWLDPSIEGDVQPRKTPSQKFIASYAGRDLVLETTRGDVCIAFEKETPYAATNFRRLADAGKMDHMLWHRVIPDFVAQAGAVEDPEINQWGSIREEWFVSDHTPGTVGLATAGKDTGGTQFFINTAYNLHLNGRYTVFGHVVKGMDAAYKLEEGDEIKRAYTVGPGDAHCQ